MAGKTFAALLVKFIATFGATWISFSLMADNPLSLVFLVALLGTVMNYVLGDLVVLPKFGNVVAAIGDGVMGALLAYIVSLVSNFSAPAMSLLVFAVLIIGFELVFHMYLKRDKDVPPHMNR